MSVVEFNFFVRSCSCQDPLAHHAGFRATLGVFGFFRGLGSVAGFREGPRIYFFSGADGPSAATSTVQTCMKLRVPRTLNGPKPGMPKP